MKTLAVAITVWCILLSVVVNADGETSAWHVDWSHDPGYDIDTIEVYESPGFILPDLNVSEIISAVGAMWQADDLVHAFGTLCVQMGPRLNWLSGGAVEELCEPILEALRNGSYAQAYSICQNTWSFVENLFGEEEEDESFEIDSGNYYTISPLIESLFNDQYRSQYDTCQGLSQLLFDQHSYFNSMADRVINVFLIESIRKIPDRCSKYEEIDGSGDFEEGSFLTYDPGYDVFTAAFSALVGYADVDKMCSVAEQSVTYDGNYDSLLQLAGDMFLHIHNITTNHTHCVNTANIFNTITGLEPTSYSDSSTSEDLCTYILGIFDLTINTTDYKTSALSYDDSFDNSLLKDWFKRLVYTGAALYHNDDDVETLQFLCHLSDETNDNFCESVSCQNTNIPQEDFESSCQSSDVDGGICDEEEFDFQGLLLTVGEAFGFDFTNSDQTCSHLVDILFDETVIQEYTVNYVMLKAFEAVVDIVGPLICDLDSYNTDSDVQLVGPCESPGQGCFNWTMHGEDYFSNDDVEFIIGTIFSFLGGYQDGDNLCHHMAFAVNDATKRTDIATRMRSSIFRLFENTAFCSDTIDLIGNIVGSDVDFVSIIGFNSSEDLCTTISDTYNQGGDYEVSLEPLFALFGLGDDNNDGDNDDADNDDGEEEEFQTAMIMNATNEIIKFAAMLIHSDNVGDAANKICRVWNESAGVLEIQEINDLCNMILAQDSEALSQTCHNEIIPLLEIVLGEIHGNFDLSNIRICLDNGGVSFDAFEDLDILAYLLNSVNNLYNLTEFDQDNVCTAMANVIQSRKNIPTLIKEFAVEMLSVFLPVGSEICSCWNQVFSQLFAEVGEDEVFGLQQFNEIVLIAVNAIGYDDRNAFCQDLVSLQPNNISLYAESLVDEFYSFMEEPEKCACFAREVLDFVAPLADISVDEINDFIYEYLGFHSVDEVCSYIAFSFSGVSSNPANFTCEPRNVCPYITDCAGECGGNAKADCAGVCLGTSVVDCAFVCGGTATVNDCGWCVGGTTGRASDFKIDQCGFCEGESLVDIDCNGDCNGTAYRDACQVCVGGNTGVVTDVSASKLDCFGVCRGIFVLNDCEECLLPNSDGSVYSSQDCNDDCNGFATINECDFCTGGNTGIAADAGLTDCGVCNTASDADFCLGCDGIAFSGLTYDACGECDGDASMCFTIDSIEPSVIPANTEYTVRYRGAGFHDATTRQCVYHDTSDEEVAVVDIEGVIDDWFNCTTSLAAGTYKVYLSTETTELSSEHVTLYVYPEITVSAISDTTFDIDEGVSSINVTMTSTNGAFTAYKSVATPIAIVYTDTDTLTFEGRFGGDNDELLAFTGPMMSTSTQVTVYPSINGIDHLATPDDAGFTITYYAKAPVVQQLQFSTYGNFLKLEFDVAINNDAVTSCDAIFNDTTSLGSYAECYAYAFSKIIYILPGASDTSTLIQPGDQLTIKDDVLQKRGEEYAHHVSGTLTVMAPDEAVAVYAVLTGTEKVSSCGNVKLSALQSIGNAGRDFSYQWSVTSDGSIPTALTDELSAATDVGYVSITGSNLDSETPYNFRVTVENFLGVNDTDTLQVTRASDNRPDVVIIPGRVDIDNALISEWFYLRADVTFYDGCGGAQQIDYAWSVDDSSIALNLQTKNSAVLYVPAGSLPGDSSVTFTLRVNRADDPGTVTEQTVTIATVYSELVAHIDGGSEQTIGVDSGEFLLDGSASYDPDNEDEPMTYVWTCQAWNAVTGIYEPCVSSETKAVFPVEAESKSSTLTLQASVMYPDTTYQFTLVVTKVSRNASTSVAVLAKAGNPPKISILSAPAVKIQSTVSQTLQVDITHTTDITVEWATVNTDLGNGYVDFSQLNAQNFKVGDSAPFHTYAFVPIPAGTLEHGVTYSFRVTVTDTSGQVSSAKMVTTTYGGVSSCTAGLSDGSTSYQELDQITILTQKCVTDEDAYPLSYQVLQHTVASGTSRYSAMTGALAEGSVEMLGLPAASSGQNTYVVKVCNKFDSCSLYSLTLNVTEITSFTQEEFDQTVTNHVEPEKLKANGVLEGEHTDLQSANGGQGNYMSALVKFNTISSIEVSSNMTRRRRAASQTSSTATEQLSLLQSAIDSTVLDTSTAQTLLDQASFVTTADLTLADIDTYLDILISLVAVFSDEELSESSAQFVLERTGEIAAELDPQYNADMLAKIGTLTNSLVQSRLSEIALGGDPVDTSTDGVKTRALHAIPSETFSSSSGNNAFTVRFGSEIESLYGASWSCGSGSTCTGVQIRFTQYDDDVDYYSVTDEDKANRASSILEISLLDPSDDSELNVTGLSTPISINMTATRLQAGKLYNCFWWDTDSNSWNQDGLTTIYHSSNESECLAYHLTAFALVAVDEPTTVSPTTANNELGSTTEDNSAQTGSGGLSTTIIIVIAVVVGGVVVIVVLVIVAIVMSRKPSGKVGAADVENANNSNSANNRSTRAAAADDREKGSLPSVGPPMQPNDPSEAITSAPSQQPTAQRKPDTSSLTPID